MPTLTNAQIVACLPRRRRIREIAEVAGKTAVSAGKVKDWHESILAQLNNVSEVYKGIALIEDDEIRPAVESGRASVSRRRAKVLKVPDRRTGWKLVVFGSVGPRLLPLYEKCLTVFRNEAEARTVGLEWVAVGRTSALVRKTFAGSTSALFES